METAAWVEGEGRTEEKRCGYSGDEYVVEEGGKPELCVSVGAGGGALEKGSVKIKWESSLQEGMYDEKVR